MAKKIREFEDTTVWFEVQDILKNSKGTRLFVYKGVIHTPDEDIGVWELNDIETIRDYIHDVASVSKISFRVGLGDYLTRIYPHRTNLEFTVSRVPLKEGSVGKKTKEETLVRRYKAYMNPKNNPPVAASDLQNVHREDLNVIDMVQLRFELLDRNMEPLRVKFTSGIYKDFKLEECIRATLGWESNQVQVDGKPVIDAIDIVEPDNKEKIEHIIFPSATHLSAVPTLLQEKIGVYNRGIGTYFQIYRKKKTWFVYPLYDKKRFDEVEYKAIFYGVPQEKLPQLDRSYWEDDKILKIAVTAQRLYGDSAELDMLNRGSGFRMPDARAYMKKPVTINEEAPKADRAKLNHEVVTKERDDGLNYAPMVTNGPSANPYLAKSFVLSHTFAQMDFVWENGDEELVYPGMPCKYVYISQGQAIELKGTILVLHCFASKAEKQDIQAFRSTIRLTIAVEAQRDVPKNDYLNLPGEQDIGETI